MGRWKQQDATVCIFGTVNCAFGENASDARRIVTEHNTDCDAYEEKIAELQRRLDAIREVVPEGDNTKWSSWQMVTKIHAILYPKEPTNG